MKHWLVTHYLLNILIKIIIQYDIRSIEGQNQRGRY